jgi:L-lactate dehydrogenase complex protein LldG
VSARDQVLARIRRSLGVTGIEVERNATVDDRLRRAPTGVIPARGQLPAVERLALFTVMAERAFATVARVATADDIPGAIAVYLRSRNLPASVKMGTDPLLAGLPWASTAVEVARGPSDGNDPVSLSHAFAGVAESGTLVLASGGDNPTTLNLLPETHIAVVDAADVVGDYETVWARLRAAVGKGLMPRTVNMITGPSRSGDIEQNLLLGAHGPHRLHIVVVG